MVNTNQSHTTFRSYWLFLLCLCVDSTVFARLVQKVTQPIGRLVRTYNVTGPLPFPVGGPPPVGGAFPTNTPVELVNYISAQWDSEEVPQTASWDVNFPITEIILTQPQHFVRLLGTPQSSANGSWIMRSEYVRGKTPAELRDIFALPVEPIEICDVLMPASPDPVTKKNYVLWTGIAGAIRAPGYDWGDGGGVQNRLVSDFNGTSYFPTYRFTSSDTRSHRQPIGAFALSYRPMAGTGNTQRLAAYLDTYIPQAYSDLENVYTELDYLNYVGFGPCPLRNALDQISPERYDAIPFTVMRNTLLFSQSLFEWQFDRHRENRWLCEADTKPLTQPQLWMQSVNEYNSGVTTHHRFRYHTNGALAALDWQLCHHLTVGLSVAALANKIHWFDRHWKAHGGSAKFGLYLSYAPRCFFIDGLVSCGGNWASTCRRINFNTIDRTTSSHPSGEEIAAHLQTGLTAFPGIIPYGRLSYLFNQQNRFREHGAQSLNFEMLAYRNHTLHTDLGVELHYTFEKPRFALVPHVQFAWADDFFLKKHKLKARLCGPSGCVALQGICRQKSYFMGGAGIDLVSKCSQIIARYDAQVRGHNIVHGFKIGLQMNL